MGFNAEASLPEAGLGFQAVDDIAIVGYSFKLPRGIDDDFKFWEVLQDRRNLSTEWPTSRINIDSFLNGKSHTVCPNLQLSHIIATPAHHFVSSMAAVATSSTKMWLALTLLSFLSPQKRPSPWTQCSDGHSRHLIGLLRKVGKRR